MTVVQIEKRKIEFLVPIDIPAPKFRIGQLVMVNKTGSWLPLDERGQFPARITGMMWEDFNTNKPRWEYEVKLSHLAGMQAFEAFHEDEMYLLEDC
ncbi:hypothetical protein [Planktothrix sp.]|uniref:hypothetical protein n=1 Tax=Planktothrix sp. TaxID=3088171 RepID=UPI0038D429E7